MGCRKKPFPNCPGFLTNITKPLRLAENENCGFRLLSGLQGFTELRFANCWPLLVQKLESRTGVF